MHLNLICNNQFQLIPGVEITVGHDKDDGGCWPYAGTAGAVEQMGAKHVNKDVHISFEISNNPFSSNLYETIEMELFTFAGHFPMKILWLVMKML